MQASALTNSFAVMNFDTKQTSYGKEIGVIYPVFKEE